jgi:transporter family-2 protein
MSSLALSLLSLFSGGLLAIMVFFNGLLAKYIQPLEASLVIHLVGLIAALALLFIKKFNQRVKGITLPKWNYLAGIFGGIAVALIGITVNSPIGITGTVALLVLGQVLYGWINDTFGLFGSQKRRLSKLDLLQAIFILTGVGVLIYG